MTHKIYNTFFFVLAFNICFAQNNLSLHFMQDIWQSNQTNPAILTNQKFTVALPSIGFNLNHTGASFNDLIITNSEGVKVLNAAPILSQLKTDNFIGTGLSVQTLGFAVRLGDFQIGLQHGTKVHSFLDYPSTLAKLIWEGNAQYIGETVLFGPDFSFFSYSELALSGAYQLGNLSIGGRIKYLNGLGDISTVRNEISVYTEPEAFDLTFQTDLLINSSSFLDIQGLTDLTVDFSDISFGKLFTKNTGLAFDLGAQLQVNDQLILSASVTDVGKINWKENVKNYQSEGSFTYEGLDITQIIRADSVSFEGTLDTLDQLLDFTETNESYSTSLPTRFYLSGLYQLNDRWQLGAMVFGERVPTASSGNINEKINPAFALSGRAIINEYVSVGAVYSYRNNDFTNLGLNLRVAYGPVQFYALTDNIAGAFLPLNNRKTSGRLGLNLVF